MRRPHVLRRNERSSVPDRLLAFDTETDAVGVTDGVTEARLRFGWLAASWHHRGDRWSPPRWWRFTSGVDLWAIVDSLALAERRITLAAHSAGFDLRTTQAFTHLPALGWTLRVAVIDDPPTILSWRKDRASLRIIDTLNYWRVPLRTIGDELGLVKLTMPGDDAGPDAWDRYCRRDVEVVMAAMQGLIDRVRSWDLGGFAPTAPAQAFRAWRHRHLTAPVIIDCDERALTLARRGYHGGRTEAFRLGLVPGPVEVWDVSSMYPAVMASEPMPTALSGVYRSIRPADLPDLLEGRSVVADVTIETLAADYPLYDGERLIFPTGRFRTVLPAPELRHAVERGRVVAVHEAAAYRQAIIFGSYVAEWWTRRVEAQAAGRAVDAMFAKLMLNSLYGKLGQRGITWEVSGRSDPADVRAWVDIDHDSGLIHHYRSLGGSIQDRRDAAEASDSHPAIAATVTSAARLRLLALMEALGRPHVVYVDTDSLFLDPGSHGPPSALVEPSGLGQLHHERTIRHLVIHGPKDYVADGKLTVKGLRRTAIRRGPDRYEQDTFMGLPGAVAAGSLDRMLVTRTPRVLQRAYRKGEITPDGHVRPFRRSS